MARLDIQPIDLDVLPWGPDAAAESLHRVNMVVEGHAKSAIEWYLDARRAKRAAARFLRVLAILLAALAGLIPIVSQMNLLELNGRTAIEPAWATLALGLAAFLVALDKFFGCSTAWTRFLITEHKIRERLHGFQMDCALLNAHRAGGPLAGDEIQKSLQAAKACLLEVDRIIRNETDQWVAEFQNVIQKLDEAAKAQANQESRKGA